MKLQEEKVEVTDCLQNITVLTDRQGDRGNTTNCGAFEYRSHYLVSTAPNTLRLPTNRGSFKATPVEKPLTL